MKEKAEGIRVFLRIRPPASASQSHVLGSTSAGEKQSVYTVEHSLNGSTIKFDVSDRKNQIATEIVNNSADAYSFQFRRVFDQTSTQEDVFNIVAKDCVQSVLDGYNSTVFAYGQTGSGKTYSITGGTESYEDRGIIPRALAMLYDSLQSHKDTLNVTTSISYLQIYNDKGQDLLNHGKDAKKLEELPAVTVHEGEDDITLKGLEQHYAPTLTDALNLLFLGDTNRMYCETPMNRTSSRSHCVFTVSLEMRQVGSSAVRRSKLNLVDLAGSERVARSGVVGTTLTEAKYINLSLHYLEHVIVALSEQAKGRRDHVPFRNSFMTMVLRDSLGGNCRTSMLATAHLARSMLPETLSTCHFAQRVALIKQSAKVNEETDPLLLVKKLRAEVAQLKDRLAFYEKEGANDPNREMTDDERLMCKNMVDVYLRNNADPGAKLEGFEGDLARIYYCFQVMRDLVWSGGGSKYKGSSEFVLGQRQDEEQRKVLQTQVQDYQAEIEALQVSLQQKENETNMLLEVINKVQGAKFNAATQTIAEAEAAVGGGGYSPEELARALRHRSSSGGVGVVSGSSSGGGGGGGVPTPAGQPPRTEASSALGHLQHLASEGKLSEAQAAAASQYLHEKEQLAGASGSGSGGGGGGSRLAALSDAELVQNRAAAFEAFKQSYKSYAKVEASKADLKQKYEACKLTAASLNQIVDSMKGLKATVQKLRAERAAEGGQEAPDPQETACLDRLRAEKEQYNEIAGRLRAQKEEIDGMHAFMKRAQERLTHDFEQWYEKRQKQVGLAVAMSVAQPPPQPVTGADSVALRASPLPLQPLQPPAPAVSTGTRASYSGPPTLSSGGVTAGAAVAPSKPGSAPQYSSTVGGAPLAGERGREPPGAPLASRTNGWMSPPASSLSSSVNGGGGGAHGLGLSARGPASPLAPVVPLPASAAPPAGTAAAGASGVFKPPSPSPSPGPHLSPLRPGAAPPENPFAPGYKSTGNAAADAQLAELYKAREAMRQQLFSKSA